MSSEVVYFIFVVDRVKLEVVLFVLKIVDYF